MPRAKKTPDPVVPKEPPRPKQTGSVKARRSSARLAAVQALYQIEMGSTPTEVAIGEFVRYRIGHEHDGDTLVTADAQLFADIVRGVMARRADIESVLRGALTGQWQFDRIETVLRWILCAGVFELMEKPETAPHIIINDYIDVTHAFFAGKEPGMVNGVLDRLARTLRSAEMPPRGEQP
ncbi:transcription antitermination factor NusB [Indioceanicola profundi]|uniref:transcription antitermination factor NusB n=1 Tax=Indioceanicola profundi TaxID=2220096 RepID=UPI000E6ACE7F|nr:transcription antitermination factor NusB [Indioceanicola profundi]